MKKVCLVWTTAWVSQVGMNWRAETHNLGQPARSSPQKGKRGGETAKRSETRYAGALNRGVSYPVKFRAGPEVEGGAGGLLEDSGGGVSQWAAGWTLNEFIYN